MKRYIIANWKMNEPEPASKLYAVLLRKRRAIIQRNNVVLSVPYTVLREVSRAVRGSSIAVASQDVFSEPRGAFTGEISASLLKSAGARFVIVGHSERRHILNETDNEINKKITLCLKESLTPILCVGETLRDRKAGKTNAVIKRQLSSALRGTPLRGKQILLAYEPVWAISTSRSKRSITLTEIDESMRAFRTIAKAIPELVRAKKMVCIYGGSVNEKNAKGIFSFTSVAGVLVGGASLKLETFQRIIERA